MNTGHAISFAFMLAACASDKSGDTAQVGTDTGGETTDSGNETGDTAEEPVDTAEEARELRSDDFSSIGQSVISSVSLYQGARYRTWNYSAEHTLDESWLIQTPPESHWGMDGIDISMDLTCTDANCDPDFNVPLCASDSDCPSGSVCHEMEASRQSADQQATAMCVGPSESFLEEIYKTIISGESFVDIATLGEPDGRFIPTLRNAFTRLDSEGRHVQVRIMLAHLPGLFLDTSDVLDTLVRDIGDDTSLSVYVGAYQIGFTSWNHAKIIAADGEKLLQGGHNMWTDVYLSTNPIHDLSMTIQGEAAADSHRFLNPLWEHACSDIWFGDWTDHTSFPSTAPDCPANYTEAGRSTLNTGTRVVSLGRLGALGENPTDEALLAAVRASESVIRLSQQDIAPIRVVGDTSITDWPEGLIRELAYAMVRGLDVYLIISGSDSIPGATSDTYSNGWSPEEVARTIEDWILDHPGIFNDDDDVHAILCEKLHVATIRFSDQESWPNGGGVGNHSKLAIFDDEAFYLGSQNLYPANLAEFGLLVDDPEVTGSLIDRYWDPLWLYSRVTAVSGADAEICSF